jgi:hypothetical protein
MLIVARPTKITFAELGDQGVRDHDGVSLSKIKAERGARYPSHANSQIGVLAVEQKLVEHVEAAHGNQRGGDYLHATRMRPKN